MDRQAVASTGRNKVYETASVGLDLHAILADAELDAFWLLFFVVSINPESNSGGDCHANDEIDDVATLHG